MRVRFDPTDLSDRMHRAAFGYVPPRPYREVLSVFAAHSGGSRGRFTHLTQDILGHMLAGPTQRYGNTPPEMLIFGATGFDGGHLGFLLHAPEILQPDLPVASFDVWEGW